MSDTDSFIDEVSEEVRRDRLFILFKRYGWIGILAVLLLVGGAAFNEWNKAKQTRQAQALGDSILDVLDEDQDSARVEQLSELTAGLTGESKAVVDFLIANEDVTAGSSDAAMARLDEIIGNTALPQLYRDLALFKKISAGGSAMAPQERIDALSSLTVGGSSFRLLAEEQIALAEIELGEVDQAASRLRDILADNELTSGLRQRASQLIVALGQEL